MTAKIDSKVLSWVLEGETGSSSLAMAAHLTGRRSDGSWPLDGGDFRRCLGLLDAVPELRKLLPRMAEVNDYWAALVAKWDKVEALARKKHWARTYSLMQRIYGAVRDEEFDAEPRPRRR